VKIKLYSISNSKKLNHFYYKKNYNIALHPQLVCKDKDLIKKKLVTFSNIYYVNKILRTKKIDGLFNFQGNIILKTPTSSTYDTTFGCEFLLRTLLLEFCLNQ
jgi:hypothetical protein